MFHTHRFNRFTSFTAPRRPRHPLLRMLVGLLGVGLLLALLFVGVFVGVAMLVLGMAWRLWKQRGKPIANARRTRSIDGDFRILGKAPLTAPR